MIVVMLSFMESIAQDKDWKPLFNGQNLTGWNKVGPGEFVVEEGKIKTTGGLGLLYFSNEKFGDAVIRVVYMVRDNDSNSGVFIRIPEKPTDPWYAVNKGYEVQIDNGVRHVGGEFHSSGVLYSLTKAMSHPQKKAGEWNELVITLDGLHTIVVLNGQMVTDFKEGDPVPDKTREFEPDRGPRPASGFIGIQNHDSLSTVFFKEISVKKLQKH